VACRHGALIRAPYVGHNGWVGVRFDGAVDWDELEDLITEGYRMTAPKRLSALLWRDRQLAV